MGIGMTGPTLPTLPTSPTGGATSPTNGSTMPTYGATVPTGVTSTAPPVPGPTNAVDAFFEALRELTVEASVSIDEANEAITLFSVVSLLLGGSSTRQVGDQTKDDVLGVLTLYYGLQDNSLPAAITLNTRNLWNDGKVNVRVNGKVEERFVRDELQNLRDDLDKLGADVKFLHKEAKRQFNLGLSNEAPPNTEFPRLFSRYVNILADPLLSIDIRAERDSRFSDKEKVGRALDLLMELKGVILQLVRSLSKYGTIATSRANLNWADYEGRALRLLQSVGNTRFTNDIDDSTPIAVLADLTGKNRDTVVAPYIVLARNGGTLLRAARDIYLIARDNKTLETNVPDELLQLFQSGSRENWRTEIMRREAQLIQRYPLPNWGTT
jgi:hypothetical protein